MTLIVNGNKVNPTIRVKGKPTTGFLLREISSTGALIAPTESFTFSLPDNATDVGPYMLSYAFYECAGVTSANLSPLTAISGRNGMYYAFYNCSSLTSLDLSALITISGNSGLNRAFYGCTSLVSVNLSSLTNISSNSGMLYTFFNCSSLTSLDLSALITISGTSGMSYAFYGCTSLASINFSSLATIGTNSSSSNSSHFSQAFYNCTNLTSITFPSLEEIYCTGSSTSQGTFANNNKIQKMYFPKLHTITYGTGASTSNQTACKNIFYSCSSLTELHFSATNQAAIESSPGYSTAWGRGAGNVTIYFDL